MQNILEVRELKKSYKDKEVIKGIDFTVQQGEILCFLGPNGAGKSTTINILTGALGYDDGHVLSFGSDIHNHFMKYKKKLGIVPQDLALYDDLSAERNVRFFASLYGLKGKELKEKCRYALEFAGLYDRAKDKVNTFSGGMKRRLNIACAIAHHPEMLIMDEPTVGIDPQSRNHILQSVKNLRKNGMTVLYTTHYMEEVEEISSRIIVMDEGKIIAEGTKDELKADINHERHYQIEAEYEGELNTEPFYYIDGVKDVSIDQSTITINTLKSVENLDRIISCLMKQSVKINDISCQTASLETVFLKLTGKSLRD